MNLRTAAVLALFSFAAFFRATSSQLYGQDATGPEFLSLQGRVVELFDRYRTSVVRIKATKQTQEGKQVKRSLKMGTGFFVSNEGHVLTTGLLRAADRVWVELGNNYYLSEVVGEDPLSNLALLKVKNLPEKFAIVPFGEASEVPPAGTFLLAITAALEFTPGPLFGLAQGTESSFGNRIFPTSMMRASLPLGPGEVGAPVLGLDGKFVGMTYAALPNLRFYSSVILPAKACAKVRDDLLLTGKVSYGWFGLTVTRALNEANGFDVVVEGAVEGSPAASADLRKGDRLLRIGEVPVRNRGDVAQAAFYTRPGQFVTFLVRREDKELEVPVRVASRPASPPGGDEGIAKVGGVVPDANGTAPPPVVPEGNATAPASP